MVIELLEPSSDATSGPADLRALTDLLGREYGLSGDLVRLGSERDDTLRLAGVDGPVLVKVAATAEPRGVIDLQIAALTHLGAAVAVPVPGVRTTRGGATTAHLPAERGTDPPRIVYVMEYLHGAALAVNSMTYGQAERVGTVHGEITVGLAGFRHPSADRRLLWDLGRLPQLRPLVERLTDPARRTMARKVMHLFEAEIVSRVDGFEQQVVHGDYSVHNVLADPADCDFVTGVIDLGDIHRGPVFFDLAIAVSNLLDHRRGDPWALGGAHARGFFRVHALPDDQRELLALTAVARSLQRALISQRRAEVDPSRAEYALGHALHDWSNIEIGIDSLDTGTEHFLRSRTSEPGPSGSRGGF